MNHLRCVLLLLLLTLPCPASDVTLSLSEIPSRVRSAHPSLKAARLAVDEAKGRHLAAGRLSNPTAAVDYQNESRVSPSALMVSIDQSFPVTHRLSLEKKLTSQLVSAAELEVRDAERRIIAEAQSLAVRILALNQQRALRIEQTALATELSNFVKGRADAGELSALDSAQAQVDAQRLRMEGRRLETETVSLLGAIKPMLGLPPSDQLTLAGDLPPLTLPKNENGSADCSQRADFQLAQTKAAAAKTDVDLARQNKWQDLSAGFFAAHEEQTGIPTGFAGFRMSIPLPLWNQNQGEVAEKTASAERARLESVALTQTILSEAETARKEMLAQAHLASETRDKLLPLVMEQTSKLEKAYENGQTDLLTVLRAREQRVQMNAAALEAVRDFHLARIRYEAATGQHAPAAPSSNPAPPLPHPP
jgi:cobalt-zinc-cadmium efflux system outer membrane protein